MAYHDRNLHTGGAEAVLTAHIRAAAADGAAGRPFEAPHRTPFRSRMAAQEDAYIAWSDARALRRTRQNMDALDQQVVDRAIEKQPHAFEFPGHCPSLSPAGVGPSTIPPVGGPERRA